jgi:short-subunit dehydrogenase
MAASGFQHRYGPWALVAGASEGLGAEFVRQIAARGLNVLALARRQSALEQLATEVRAAHPVEVRTAALDLGSPTLERDVNALVAGLEVGLLVYNAAYSPIGRFLDVPLSDKLQAIDVNCRGPLVLSHLFAQPMAARGRGGLVLVSSMASLQGSALVATYAATKAFDTVLAEGLWNELRDRGVDVLACCAGSTETPGYLRSEPKTNRKPMPPTAVVAETLEALAKGPRLFPGRGNRLAAFLMTRILPKRTAINVMGRATRSMYQR